VSSAIGICIGATNIKVVVLSQTSTGVIVSHSYSIRHNSNPKKALADIMRTYQAPYGILTGRKFCAMIKAPSIPEPEALENGLAFLRKLGDTKIYPAILSMGAENFIVYRLNKNDTIASIETGNKCASGTGEFFMQQIGRMDTIMAEAIEQAHHTHPYKVSGRCSVFCKSDCTHALNSGIPIGRVTAGLCEMIADKALDLLQKTGTQDLLAVGGVTNNTVIMEHLRKHTHNLTVAPSADVFEALGAAYYALINKISWEINKDYIETNTSFSFLPPISRGTSLVHFETTTRTKAQAGDECVLGLDAGSTTTKAVLIRLKDNAIVASAYLRTNGNPIKAARECYQELQKQIHHKISIVGMGTTGSGRQITGLHAQTDGIINEIIAHATGAAFFNKDVDTIFEIGGQDAKYTHLVNGVPADYAMNEACSAGTGSFIEESVRENMGLFFTDIETIALAGQNPPDFNDQCAAFISSDIKTAIHEGITRENIVAGLVYSICMNYVNRVKGSRSIGKKIFMQGGVCYNKAIPIAMANLIQREIIVPPEPGLIGAFGVALEIKNRIETNHYDKRLFDLTELINREITYGKSFVCQGNSHCDRKCEISNMIVDGRKLPFGGACNKYYNFVHHVFKDTTSHDYVQKRQNLHFHTFAAPLYGGNGLNVGIPRSFLANMLYPFYSYFFSILGCRVVLSDVDPEGLKKTRSSFCYPAEIAHGCYSDLLNKQVDYIFLPKTIELYVDNSVSRRQEHQCTCMILQNEPYYLKSAFKSTPATISPVIDYSRGWETMAPVFEKIAADIGIPLGRAAFYIALKKQREYTAQLKTVGRKLLDILQDDPQTRAIVLFGRPYNAFAKETNMGIPTKFASRGEYIIPWDMLPFEDEYCDPDMNWAIGQNLMKAAQFTAKHPQLFGAWITNFSCGPDSFLVGYFRDIMGTKPSLTLELDSHTADAGINTRIEAFLDIITKYTQPPEEEPSSFKATRIEGRTIIDGNGVTYDLYDPIVHWLIPSMGQSSVLLAAALAGSGIRSISVEDNDNETLHLGRQYSSGKECLPLQLVTGSLLKYLKNNRESEILVYFMPTCGGNCRFSQYNVFLRNLIEKKQIRDVAILSLTNENGYAGLSPADTLNILKALYIGDVMDDIKNTLTVIASDPKYALDVFEEEYLNIADSFLNKNTYQALQAAADRFRTIPLKYPLSEARVIALMGEVFVRRDMFACRSVIEMLRKHGIIAHRAHLTEWLAYCDYNVSNKIYDPQFSWMGKLQFRVKKFLDKRMERKIKSILASSGLYTMELIDIDKIITAGKHFFDPRSTGEAILVAGSFFNSVPNHYLGAISIGPFACMPSRVIESILSVEATGQTKQIITGVDYGIDQLPFLAIETDGNPLPQILEARIEAFCLQVKRIKPWIATT
jgi:predicted CoA-substrate-specific enzyme activase